MRLMAQVDTSESPICTEPIGVCYKYISISNTSFTYPAYWTANLINISAFLNSRRTTHTC